MQDQTNRPLVLVLEQPAFPLGFVAVTAGAQERLSPGDIESALNRHARADWGDMGEEDRRHNDQALRTGGGVLSVHRGGENRERFYVITDPGHTVTTVLLPCEY
jgi:hypothetical protein